MRISDWSSDVCSSDLGLEQHISGEREALAGAGEAARIETGVLECHRLEPAGLAQQFLRLRPVLDPHAAGLREDLLVVRRRHGLRPAAVDQGDVLGAEAPGRSEEHTSELQSLMRRSYAVFCLKKK